MQTITKQKLKLKKEEKNQINHATSSNLYWSYYPHRSRELVSPVCGIFKKETEPFLNLF